MLGIRSEVKRGGAVTRRRTMLSSDELLRAPIEAYLACTTFTRPRGGHGGGEDHPTARLTNEQAREIRALYKTGKWSYLRLAVRFKVGESTIRDVVSWRTFACAGGDATFAKP